MQVPIPKKIPKTAYDSGQNLPGQRLAVNGTYGKNRIQR
jgi:hypothetical protein